MAVAGPAMAQSQSAAPAAAGVEEVVVTARRVEERLQDVPLAVSAVSGAALQRQGVKEVKDLSATVPNLAISSANAGGSSIVLGIRGQIQANVGLLFVDPAVGVYVDGLNVPRNFGLRSGLVDIQRVEVLRGPQGTLYGRNTTGGAMSVVTQDPRSEFGGSLQASYGNYNAWNVLGVLNMPLANGLALRLVGQHGEHDAYGKQIATGVGLYDEKNTYLRAKLKYDNGGRFRASATADYFDYRSSGPVMHLVGLTPATTSDTRFSGRVANVPGAVAPTPTNPLGIGTYAVAGGTATNIVRLHLGLPLTPAGLDAASRVLASYVRPGNNIPGVGFYDALGTSSSLHKNVSNSSGGSVAATLEYDLTDNVAARSISGWRRYQRDEFWDLDGTPFPLLESGGGTPFDNFYSEELQLLGDSEKLTWVVGGYYSYERGQDLTPGAVAQPPGASPVSIADGLSRSTSKAVFGQASYKITGSLTATLGARYTQEIRKFRNRNRNNANACLLPLALLNDPNGPILTRIDGSVGPCGANLEAKFDDPSWLASLDYQMTPDVLVYGKVARGFRGGGHQGRANTPTIVSSFEPFRPETVTEYEAGLKSQFMDRRVTLNLAAFYDNYQDVQRTVLLINPQGFAYSLTSNAATARLYGLEAESAWRLTDALTVSGSLGYLNAKYKAFQDAALGDRSGEQWPAPKWNYSITVRYAQPTGFGQADATLQWAGRSTYNLQPQGLLRDQNTQHAYGLLNGTTSLRFDAANIEVGLFGRNLLNKKYYVGGTTVESLGFNALITGEPRTFGLQVTKKFGGE
jgi:iron complex outermembrane recepter protein